MYFSYFCVREHPLGASFARATHFWERLNDAAGHLPHVDRGRIPTPIFDYWLEMPQNKNMWRNNQISRMVEAMIPPYFFSRFPSFLSFWTLYWLVQYIDFLLAALSLWAGTSVAPIAHVWDMQQANFPVSLGVWRGRLLGGRCEFGFTLHGSLRFLYDYIVII